MNQNPVAFFEVPASNFKKAKEFYEKVFDWKVELWGDEGAMAYTTAVDKDQNPIQPGGINGGFYLRKSKDDQPSLGVQTGSIDKTLKAIEKAGGGRSLPRNTPSGNGGSWRISPTRRATSLRSGRKPRNERDESRASCRRTIAFQEETDAVPKGLRETIPAEPGMTQAEE